MEMSNEGFVPLQNEHSVLEIHTSIQNPDIPMNKRSRFKILFIISISLLALVLLFTGYRHFKIDGNREFLIGISSVSSDLQRRSIIRKYQIEPYKHYNITWRFFISNPTKIYEALIEEENKKYGDIIILGEIPDNKFTAREVKPYHFFWHVEDVLGKYKYVAKMDDDAFINVPLLMQQYMTEEVMNLTKNYVGRMLIQESDEMCPEAMGWFYALSWDLLLIANNRLKHNYKKHIEEDFQVGLTLCESKTQYNMTNFPVDKAHDLQLNLDPPANYFSHPVWNQSVLVHQLKSESQYIKVGECCDINGFNQTCIDQIYQIGW